MRTSYIATILVLALVLVCAAVGTYLYVSIPRDAQNSLASRSLATTDKQAFVDLSGSSVDLSAYKGQVRIVGVWASWSPSSSVELAELQTLANDYAQKHVVSIAVNRKESKEQAERYLKTLGNISNVVVAIDLNDTYYQSVGGYAMPEIVIYDAHGNIVEHVRGDASLEQLRKYVDKALSIQ